MVVLQSSVEVVSRRTGHGSHSGKHTSCLMTVRGRGNGTALLPRLTLFSEEQAKPAKMSPRQVSLFVRLLSFFHSNLTAANLSVGRAPLDVRTGRPRGREREAACLSMKMSPRGEETARSSSVSSKISLNGSASH